MMIPSARAICAVPAVALLLMQAAEIAQPARASRQQSADLVPNQDYPVYNAVLADIEFSRLKPANQIHALIVNDTLNLGCGENSKNPIMLNGCSPMLMPPTTADDLHKMLRDEFHFHDAIWLDLLAQNGKSWRLQDHFKTPWLHGLTGAGIDPASLSAPEWKNPDCAFYFSRVGFDETRKQAIVFVFFASYLDRAPSSGDYFFLKQHENDEWKIDGRLNYFNSTKDASEN
jgi:hypothetical protein